MKKAIQESINHICRDALGRFRFSTEHGMAYWSYKRLRTCNAYVFENRDYIWLCSYRTVVAFYDKSNASFYDVLRLVYGYTSTSAQHIAKFRNDYARNTINNYRYQAV